jgi:hypothetical protein
MGGGDGGESQNLSHRITDRPESRLRQHCQGTQSDSLVVDSPQLVDQEIRILLQSIPGINANAQGRGIIHKVCREGDHQGGGVVDVEEGLILNDKHGSDLSGFGSAPRVQVGQPNLA